MYVSETYTKCIVITYQTTANEEYSQKAVKHFFVVLFFTDLLKVTGKFPRANFDGKAQPSYAYMHNGGLPGRQRYATSRYLPMFGQGSSVKMS